MNEGNPLVLAQVVHARTKWGHAARCGCGWLAIRQTDSDAVTAGARHLNDAHGDVERKINGGHTV